MAQVWLVIEEMEAGSFADGTTYCVLSAHTTEKGADAAKREWLAGPCQGAGEPPHAMSEDGWCRKCGSCVVIEPLELQEWIDRRHLHVSRIETLCGLAIGRGSIGRDRKRLMAAGRRVVHATKARRTDCEACRKAFRASCYGGPA